MFIDGVDPDEIAAERREIEREYAGETDAPTGPEWREIAVAVALGGGTYHRLTSGQRDALEQAITEAGYAPPGVGPVKWGEVRAL